VRHHSLTDTAFGSLGAGRPDVATIRELRRAQLGKHLLLLREIVRAGTTPSWYARLAADPDEARRALTDPLFGAWATHCLKSLRAGRSPTAAGVDRLPDASGGRLLIATHNGLTLRVRLEDSDPTRARLGLTPTGRRTDTEVAHWRTCLSDAWQILVSRHRSAAEILAEVVACVVPVEPDPAARGISATSADAFGAVAMSAPADGLSLAVALLHEAQHSILNATQYLFDLHQDPNALGYSPWRDDPRPASGILHGAYAYLAVARFWRVEARHSGDPLAAFEFARWRAAVAEVGRRLLDTGRLTPAGARFVTALHDEVQPWLTETLCSEHQYESGAAADRGDSSGCSEQEQASDSSRYSEQEQASDSSRYSEQRLAEVANLDHYLRWRLRNLAVDLTTGTSQLVPAPKRALENSARLDLIHRSLSGNNAGGRATAGDAALLRGHHGTARHAYREMILNDPDDDAAWTGLAIVTGRTDRLEIVVGTYRAQDDRARDDRARDDRARDDRARDDRARDDRARDDRARDDRARDDRADPLAWIYR
jgi:hypothetical protein